MPKGPAAKCDVLFVLPFMNAGGGERWFTTLADGLSARGHRVWAFVLKQDEGHFRDKFEDYLLCGPLEGIVADVPRYISHYIDLTRPKALVFHGSDVGAHAVLSAIHHPQTIMVKHTVWPEDAQLCLRPHVQEAVDTYVCVSEANARHLVASGAPVTKVQAIRNAVDARTLASDKDLRAELGIPSNMPTLLHLGRICENKGSVLLAQALVAAPVKWCSVWVGWGDRVSTVRDITSAIQPRVRMLPADTDVGKYLAAADLMVMPTKAEGGVPYAAMEAMACDVPVACTEVADIPALFEDKVSYLRIDHGVESIVEMLEWGVEHESRLQAVGREGHKVIEKHCSLTHMIDHYEEALGLA